MTSHLTSHLYLLLEEIRRLVALMRRYWMDELSFAITIYLLFLGVLYMGGALTGQVVQEQAKAATLVGMLMWQLSLGSMSVLGWSFYNEAAVGTLEHLYLSPFGAIRVFLARSVANFLSMLAVTSISGALAILTTGVRLHLPPLELAVILPASVAGTYGFGFLIAALTLTFKRTQQVMQLLQFFFLIFTGAAVPLEQMHWSLRAFGELLPMTAGLRALRAVTVAGAGLGDVTGDLLRMGITTAAWLALGIAVYRVADRRARLRGSIGQY
ncbi:MAG: ABC transporter permease [Bacillota bacterium]